MRTPPDPPEGTPPAPASPGLLTLFERVPPGWSQVEYDGRRYGVTRSVHAEGRSVAVYAEELGGTDVVSANLYLTSVGETLRPCEMPAAKVVDFLAGLRRVGG